MANSVRLFGADKPKVWTIPPGADFLSVLARVLAEDTGLATTPDALTDAVIYVPNQRSVRVLTLALFDAAGGKPILPPDIRALGDLESDEAPPNAETALIGLPPALSPAKRLGALASLVRRYYASEYRMDLPPASAIAAARELSRLLDQAALSEHATWDGLKDLARESDLAGHWQSSVKFLEIITKFWPEWLDDNNAMDPFARRLAAAEALADEWAKMPPQAPVIIAGSTGATPAGRLLMKAALGLPRGLVVLPGLDTDADEETWNSIRASVSHPQNALIDALDYLSVVPDDVAVWPGLTTSAKAAARRRLIHEALAPADSTADWRETLETMAKAAGASVEDFTRGGLEGLTVIEAPDEAAEAETAALLLRRVLETPGQTAALVTPDAGLARRVAALMKRWGVEVSPSAGVPLGRTPAGSLIGLCADWAVDPSGPVALTAVLKHPFVSESTLVDAGELAVLERYFLRGARRWESLEGLRTSILERHEIEPYAEFNSEHQVIGAAVVERLIAVFEATGADLSHQDEIEGGVGARLIADLAGAVSETPLPWAGEDGKGATSLLSQIDELCERLGPMAPDALVELVHAQSAQMTIREAGGDHPRLSIWGPLEARLQSASRVVLAGLSEDVWPHRPAPDAFLPRRFRKSLNLNDPEDRLGLSAHDFAQLACAPHVVMLHAARREDAPAVASRWVWRLKTLAQGGLEEAEAARVLGPQEDDPLGWVHQMQVRGVGSLPAAFTAEPRPTKRPEGWPQRLSVTRVDLLQRDPYAIWCEQVLKLSEVDVLNAALGPAPRGTAIHHALELLEAPGAPKTADHLMGLLEHELRRMGEPEEAWVARKAVWRQTVDWYLSWREGRDVSGGRLKLEVSGRLDYDIAGEPFTLSANADRIERTANGEIVIVDFKTGNPPTDSQIAVGFDQQMPLQALIAREGGYKDVPAAAVRALEYVAFKAKPDARIVGQSKSLNTTPDELAEIARAGLLKLVSDYKAEGAVFQSAPRPQFVKYDAGFNRLARRAEWTSDTSDGEGGGD